VTGSRSWDGQAVLESFMAGMVEDDYRGVPAEGRIARGPARAFDSVAVGAVALLIGVLVTAALFMTVSTSDARSVTRLALADRIESTTRSLASRQAVVAAERSRVEAAQERMLAADAARPAIATQGAALATSTGTSALSGPGLVIVLDDAPDALAGSLNRVLDRDLQDVVNAAWESGARGIAVNGHRLTGSAAIRSAGDAILVNYEPVAPPYVVSVVGGDAGSPLAGLLARLTRDFGLVTRLSEADVALPAGELRFPRYAHPIEGS
jgi:uncharacterized protein YlxW (UPF0749 family)